MAKTDADRGPVSAWARRERLARGWTTHDVVSQLARRGVHITEPSYRGYEAGPRVSSPVRKGLEAVFGSTAPETAKEAAEPHGLDDLIRALHAQTEAINALVSAVSHGPASTIPDQVAVTLAERLGLLPPPDGEDPPAGTEATPETADTKQPRTA